LASGNPALDRKGEQEMRFGLLGLVLVLGLAACSGTVVRPAYISGSYHPDMVNYAASRGGMRLEVIGNPFDEPRAKLERAVAEAMTDSHFGQHMPFITEVPADFTSPYRVVILFDPPRNANPKKLCQQAYAPVASQPGRVRLMAVFCDAANEVTSTGGSVGDVGSSGDPGFRKLLAQVSLLLFPPNDDMDRDNGDFMVTGL
jgi:hypothetical protein